MGRLGRRVVGVTLAIAGVSGCGAPPVDHEAEITAVLETLPVAWNARDASMWVANFAPSSDFTNILGMHFEDRAANEARHAVLFETIFSDSQLEAEVLEVRVLGGDAAVAEVAFRLIGYERLPPGVIETEPGELRTRLITVLERRDGRWQIVAAQNTAVLPAAVAPPAG
jgi:uncharacterized protein (TIGR02246 family)